MREIKKRVVYEFSSAPNENWWLQVTVARNGSIKLLGLKDDQPAEYYAWVARCVNSAGEMAKSEFPDKGGVFL